MSGKLLDGNLALDRTSINEGEISEEVMLGKKVSLSSPDGNIIFEGTVHYEEGQVKVEGEIVCKGAFPKGEIEFIIQEWLSVSDFGGLIMAHSERMPHSYYPAVSLKGNLAEGRVRLNISPPVPFKNDDDCAEGEIQAYFQQGKDLYFSSANGELCYYGSIFIYNDEDDACADFHGVLTYLNGNVVVEKYVGGRFGMDFKDELIVGEFTDPEDLNYPIIRLIKERETGRCRLEIVAIDLDEITVENVEGCKESEVCAPIKLDTFSIWKSADNRIILTGAVVNYAEDGLYLDGCLEYMEDGVKKEQGVYEPIRFQKIGGVLLAEFLPMSSPMPQHPGLWIKDEEGKLTMMIKYV
jgi:hypothetical protein